MWLDLGFFDAVVALGAMSLGERLLRKIFTKKRTREDVRKEILVALRITPMYTREPGRGRERSYENRFELDEKDTLELFYCVDQGFVDATPGGPGVMKYSITDIGKLELARIMDKQGDK